MRRLLGLICIILGVMLLLDMETMILPIPHPRPDSVKAIVIEESEDRIPEHAIVLLSSEFRGLFSETRLIDKDTPVSPRLESFKNKGIQVGLPYLFIIGPDDHVWYEGKLPGTVSEVKSIVDNIIKGNYSQVLRSSKESDESAITGVPALSS